MKKSEIIAIVVGLLLIWGVTGLFKGDGFFGGITNSIDAIGDLVSLVIKGVLVIGVIWFVFYLLDSKQKKENKK